MSITTLTNKNGTIGRIPQSVLEDQHSTLLTLHENNIDLVVCE